MMKKILTLLILVSSTLFCFAQKVVQGKVIDNQSKEPLDQAYVKSADGKAFTITDERGSFSLKIAGQAEIVVGLIGYKPSAISINDTTASILILLDRAAVDLKDRELHSS